MGKRYNKVIPGLAATRIDKDIKNANLFKEKKKSENNSCLLEEMVEFAMKLFEQGKNWQEITLILMKKFEYFFKLEYESLDNKTLHMIMYKKVWNAMKIAENKDGKYIRNSIYIKARKKLLDSKVKESMDLIKEKYLTTYSKNFPDVNSKQVLAGFFELLTEWEKEAQTNGDICQGSNNAQDVGILKMSKDKKGDRKPEESDPSDDTEDRG